MKQPRDKPLRLPQINNKTSSSFTITEDNSRVRPSSSNKLNDLEKNLFNQLNEYDDIGKKDTKKHKTKKSIEPESTKEIGSDWLQVEAPYLKKLSKIMPDTYTKLLESRKPEPLQQANNKTKPKKRQEEPKETKEKQKQKEKGKDKEKDKKKEKEEDSFAVAEREVESIFQQYLEAEGLTDFKEVTSQDLKQLNAQINSTEAEMNSLKQSMYDIIQKFGGDCLILQ